MNFDIITQDLKGWPSLLLLGIVLPAATVIVTLFWFRRLLVRLNIPPLLPRSKGAVAEEAAASTSAHVD